MTVVLFGLENLIKSERKGIVQHPRQQLLQNGRRLLYTGISVDLNQPRIAFRIQHEIISENLKAETPLLFI